MKELGRTDIGRAAIQKTFEETRWRSLPLDWDQIEEFAALGRIRDPFDRLIVAAMRHVKGKLLSRDSELAAWDPVDVVWN